MMTKLQERVHGMRKLCEAVVAAAAPRAIPLLSEGLPHVRRVLILTTVDDVPLPDQDDFADERGTLRLHFQSVGAVDRGPALFPDFVFGGWWHIGLHDFDAFASAMTESSATPATHAPARACGPR